MQRRGCCYPLVNVLFLSSIIFVIMLLPCVRTPHAHPAQSLRASLQLWKRGRVALCRVSLGDYGVLGTFMVSPSEGSWGTGFLRLRPAPACRVSAAGGVAASSTQRTRAFTFGAVFL